MSTNTPAQDPRFEERDRLAEVHRWVRRKRILYTILGIYAVLSLMWFLIDMADGTESLWIYWPTLGTGIVDVVAAVVLLGVGGLFGAAWENQQIDRYLEQHRRPGDSSFGTSPPTVGGGSENRASPSESSGGVW